MRYGLLLVLLCAGFLQAETGRQIRASFDNEFKRYTSGEVYSGEVQHQWRAVAWRGERINQGLLVWSNKKKHDLQIKSGDLVGKNAVITANNIKVFHQQPVIGDPEARNCENAYHDGRKSEVILSDALSLELPEKLYKKELSKLWVSIDIPSDIEPGTYQGVLKIMAKNSEPVTMGLVLNVLDLQLPEPKDWSFYLDLWQFPLAVLDRYNEASRRKPVIAWSDQHFELLESSYRRLANAGQKAATTYISSGIFNKPGMVEWILDEDGKTLRYDFSVFDRYVEALESWGIDKHINAFSLATRGDGHLIYTDARTGNKKALSAPVGSEIYTSSWLHFLTHFKVHLDQKGWFDKTILYMDEVPAEKMALVLRMIEQTGDNWKLGLAHGHSISTEITDGLYMVSSLLGSTAQWSEDRSEKRHTFYTSCEQTLPNSYVTPDNSPAEMAWMAWHSAAQGYDGYLRWAYDYWLDERANGLHDGAFTAGDFSLVYRNPHRSAESLSSLRFEALREGIEDFEKIALLRKQFLRCGNDQRLNVIDRTLKNYSISDRDKDEYEALLMRSRDILDQLAKAGADCDIE